MIWCNLAVPVPSITTSGGDCCNTTTGEPSIWYMFTRSCNVTTRVSRDAKLTSRTLDVHTEEPDTFQRICSCTPISKRAGIQYSTTSSSASALTPTTAMHLSFETPFALTVPQHILKVTGDSSPTGTSSIARISKGGAAFPSITSCLEKKFRCTSFVITMVLPWFKKRCFMASNSLNGVKQWDLHDSVLPHERK